MARLLHSALSVECSMLNVFSSTRLRPRRARSTGFTMIEVALCLAIIGFALVSILLVLPLGMNTQRDVRQETIIGQDASVLFEAIRSGARGYDDLTNYVYAITNYLTDYDNLGHQVGNTYINGYTYTVASLNGTENDFYRLTNGAHIIGLLSTPEFLAGRQPIADIVGTKSGYTSNRVVAYVRSISGLAAEKPPQDNAIMRDDTFAYRLHCINAPMAADTNLVSFSSTSYPRQLAGNLRELRLTFYWPQLPNGNLGLYHQTFRASVGGQMTNYPNTDFYFYQSSSFATNAP